MSLALCAEVYYVEERGAGLWWGGGRGCWGWGGVTGVGMGEVSDLHSFTNINIVEVGDA